MRPTPRHRRLALLLAMATWLLPAALHATTDSVVLAGHTSWVNAIAVSPDCQLVATGGNDGAIGLWGIDGARRHLLHLPHLAAPTGDDALVAHLGVVVNAVAFDPSGRWLAAGGGDGTIYLVAVAEGQITGQLSEASGPVNALAWLADGRLLAGGLDGSLTLWEVAGPRVVFRQPLFHFPIQGIALAPDGQRVAMCAMESRVKIAALPGLETTQLLKGHKDTVFAVAWSPDGRYLASGSNDRMVLLWDLQAGGAARPIGKQDEPVYALAFAPDSASVAIAPRGGAIEIVTVPGGESAGHLSGHTAGVTALAFPAPGLLVSGSRDATARIWHLHPDP